MVNIVAGMVISHIWATKKDDNLVGCKFMAVKLLDGKEHGKIVIAVDSIGAGIGERVILCQGSSARKMQGLSDAPVDCIIIGIIDEDCLFDGMEVNIGESEG